MPFMSTFRAPLTELVSEVRMELIVFPTPAGDDGLYLSPSSVRSNRPELPWADLFAGKAEAKIRLEPGAEPAWLAVTFATPVTLRSLELPARRR